MIATAAAVLLAVSTHSGYGGTCVDVKVDGQTVADSICPPRGDLTVRTFVYLARDLVPSRLAGDETYTIDVERVPLASFESLIASGRLMDARVVAALYLARAFLGAELQ